jgi:glucokinase
MSAERAFLGVDLGGTEIKAAVLAEDGAVLARRAIGTRGREGRDAVMDRIVGLGEWARGEVGEAQLAAVGVAVPAVLDMKRGRVELMTNLTHDWNGFLMRDALQQRMALPAVLMNDVRAATLGEQTWGAGAAYEDFICIAIGTGIGGGVVIGGRMMMGSRGAGGEIGHITMVADGPACNCGNRGCLEAVASGPAMSRMAGEAIEGGDDILASLSGSLHPAPHQIAHAAERGSATANRIFQETGRWIGQALAGVICVLNPRAVIVGGGVARAGELLLEPIRREIERRTVVFSAERGGVEVILSPLGGEAGAIGAGAWAMGVADGTV